MVHLSRFHLHSRQSGSESDVSKRSGSSGSGSRSGSAASNDSRSGSASGSRSGSDRSGSRASGRKSGSRSVSGSPASGKASRSRSRSGTPKRSRSGSASGSASNRSRSRSASGSRKSKSRSRSGSVSSKSDGQREASGERSRSGTPRKSSGSESGSDVVVRKKKKQRKSSGDEEDKSEKPVVADIFGEDLGDISDDEDGDDNENEPEREIRRMGDLDEDEADEDNEGTQQQQAPETRIDVEVPRIQTDLGTELHFVKLPNFLSVETRPYDTQTYEDEVDEDDVIDEEGRARLKLKVENTIRWRTVYDEQTGDPIKQSNARVVRWSDGSLSLHLGSEIFDVHKQTLMVGDHNHLFIRQGTGLQGQAVFRTKLSFRPHSTDSFTHRKMTLSLAGRSQKANKVRVLPTVGLDPEKNRNAMLKKEEEKLRAFMRRDNKQRRIRDRTKGMNAAYLEDDEDGISLNAIKNNAKNRPSASNIYSSDTDDSDIDGIKRRKASDKAKKIADSDEEDYFDKKEREGTKTAVTTEKEDDAHSSDSDKKSAKSGSGSESGE